MTPFDMPDIVNYGPVIWTASWAIAFAFTIWNARDNYRGLMEAIGDPESTPAVLASAWWFFRMDGVKAIGCLFMVLGGTNGMFGGSPDITRSMVALASVFMAVNQVWNRVDRQRVVWFLKREHEREREQQTIQGGCE